MNKIDSLSSLSKAELDAEFNRLRAAIASERSQAKSLLSARIEIEILQDELDLVDDALLARMPWTDWSEEN
jgi:hypothetical protein